MDPREVLLGVDLEELAGHGQPVDSRRLASDMKVKRKDRDWSKGDDVDVLEEVKRLRRTVEHDHDRRLRGIEINIRWLMVLVGGEVLAIVGFALGTVAGV